MSAEVIHGLKIKLGELKPHPRNTRRHSDEQVDQIAASIGEFAWTVPILADEDGVIIAGHGRWMAGKRRHGEGYEVPMSRAVGWTEAQKRAYVIADNRLTELGQWDRDLLKSELIDLQAGGFNLDLTGFDLSDFADQPPKGSLAEAFGVPPFSVLNARDGWWQDRKRAWLALGIQSELGRGEGVAEAHAVHSGKVGKGGLTDGVSTAARKKANATPGGSKMPAADYSKGQRGDGKGRAVGGS